MTNAKTSLSAKTIALFVAAAIALAFAVAGTARAALTYFSDDYQSDIALTELQVSLKEQGDGMKEAATIGSDGTLLSWMKTDTVAIGKKYDEVLSAANSGEQPEYVRVVVSKYWTDANGKAVTLDPDLIDLEFEEAGWIVDDSMSTPEQTILYSADPLDPTDELAFTKSIKISDKLLTKFDSDTKGNVTTITYDYDGYNFGITAEVDSVQTHSAAKAMRDVWGIDAQALGIHV